MGSAIQLGRLDAPQHAQNESEKYLYREQEGLTCYGRARQSAIDSNEEHHSQIGKGDEENRLRKVAAGQNMSSLTERGIMQRGIAERMRGDPSSWKGSAMAEAGIATGGLQFVRQICSAMPRIGPLNGKVINAGLVNNTVRLLLGINDFKSGYGERQKAVAIEDSEGVGRARGRLWSGAIAIEGSLLYLGHRSAIWSGASAGMAAGLDLATKGVCGVGSLLAMGIAGLGFHHCRQFQGELNGRLEDRAVRTEAKRCLNALEYLKNATCVTDEEVREIVEQNDPQEWEKKIRDRTEVKMNALKRRTSQKAVFMILDRLEPIVEKLADPKRKRVAAIEAHLLIGDINGEIQKKQQLYAVLSLAAAIGFAATIAGTLFTAGALPYLLSASSTAIYLALAAHAFYRQRNQKVPMITSSKV